ncbi:IS110 family transposase [Candidatus Poriferisodalis sp.]|uniref:IS110 family transposase n=1 Tax=Candidatus Poriferisodalis sp. TaxID=3101277 RepID=UPI003AF9BA33
MPAEYRAVVGGVDTHRDTHTAAAVDSTGRLLGTATFPATRAGYEQLWGWLRGLGSVERVGVGRSRWCAGRRAAW